MRRALACLAPIVGVLYAGGCFGVDVGGDGTGGGTSATASGTTGTGATSSTSGGMGGASASSASSGGGTGGVMSTSASSGAGATGGGTSGMGGATSSTGSSSSSGAASSSAGSSSTTSSTGSSSSGGATCSGPVLQGGFTIQNAIDVATLTPYSEITGDLQVNTTGVTSVSLPNLCKLDGRLFASSKDLQTLDLPAVTSAFNIGRGNGGLGFFLKVGSLSMASLTSTGDVWVGEASGIDLPSLTTTGSVSVSIPLFPSGVTNLPLLTTATQGMSFDGGVVNLTSLVTTVELGAGEGTTLNLNALTSVGSLTMNDSGVTPGMPLSALNAPLLAHVTTLDLTLYASVSIPSLLTVGAGTINVQGMFSAPKLTSLLQTTLSGVTSVVLSSLQTVQLGVLSTELTTLDLPALTSGYLALGAPWSGGCIGSGSNPLLLQLVAPSWTSGAVLFYDTTFPKCRADALCAQLGQTPTQGECFPTQMAVGPCP